jgi:predicted ArsR family transcriptional regulator
MEQDGAAVKLTVQEKILLHLYRCNVREGNPDEKQTRVGIAKVCGVSDDFVGGELCKLMKAGFVGEKRTGVQGRRGRCLIAYSLTRQGEFAAVELIREIVTLHKKVLLLIKAEVR